MLGSIFNLLDLPFHSSFAPISGTRGGRIFGEGDRLGIVLNLLELVHLRGQCNDLGITLIRFAPVLLSHHHFECGVEATGDCVLVNGSTLGLFCLFKLYLETKIRIGSLAKCPEESHQKSVAVVRIIRAPPSGGRGYPFPLLSIFRQLDQAFLLLMGHTYRFFYLCIRYRLTKPFIENQCPMKENYCPVK